MSNTQNPTGWREQDLIVFARSFRQTSAFQSLASLIQALSKLGRRVHLITQSEPSGDDFVSSDTLKRYAIDVYETRGYSTEEAFFKIISEIPVRTVLFFGDIYAKTLPFFQTAQRLGRCIVFETDRSPLYYVSAGAESLSMSCMYMIRHADCVISHSETDCELIRGMGAKKCVYLPYYFPYTETEVDPAEPEGGRFVYYTTYAGRSTRAVLTAFALVHATHPQTRMSIVTIGVRKSDVLLSLVQDVNGSGLSDCVTIETDVLKPLRFLREADVSLTYAHLVTVPETVMESMSRGIPAIQLQDADYSGDTFPCLHLDAGDENAIAAAMLSLMTAEDCRAYGMQARILMKEDVLAQQAAQWCAELDAAQSSCDENNLAAVQTLNTLTSALADASDTAAAAAALRCAGHSADAIFGALLSSGVGCVQIREAFSQSLVLQKDALRLDLRSDVLRTFEPQDAETLRDKEIVPVDCIARLAVSGVPVQQIASFYPQICLSEPQVCRSLLQTLPVELGLRDFRPTGSSAVCSTAMQAFRSYNMENARYFRTKAVPGMQRAMKYYDWKTRPYAQHGVLGKLLLLPNRAADHLKKWVQMHGRQRLLKRKVVEVDPADVRKIQLMVLNLMLEFERICKKHGLRYYLAGGTILGGIRHKGFIPWDDDMDITMPRPDYDRFLKIAQKELPPDMKLDKDCAPFCHNRIEYANTRFDTMWRNGGIFLDILALDGSPDDERLRRRHEHKTRFWRFWMLEKVRPIPPLSASRDVQFIILKRVIARLMPRRFLKWRWHSWAARYDCDKVSSWVCLPASIYTYEQERFPKEYWGEPVMMEFEGYDMPTMQHWEDYLICHFGNYMKMPPETTRKSHHFIYHYDLGPYKDIPTEELEQKLVGPKKRKDAVQV